MFLCDTQVGRHLRREQVSLLRKCLDATHLSQTWNQDLHSLQSRLWNIYSSAKSQMTIDTKQIISKEKPSQTYASRCWTQASHIQQKWWHLYPAPSSSNTLQNCAFLSSNGWKHHPWTYYHTVLISSKLSHISHLGNKLPHNRMTKEVLARFWKLQIRFHSHCE